MTVQMEHVSQLVLASSALYGAAGSTIYFVRCALRRD